MPEEQIFRGTDPLGAPVESGFFVLEYRNTHFPGLYCLKKDGKKAIFGPKAWINPFGKISIFRLFDLLVFIA